MSSFDILDRECDRAGVGLAERNYYHVTMRKESGGRANAKAATSSASGVFQFLDQTWLGTLKNHGAEYGYGRYADAIYQGRDGKWQVRDGMRAEVLNLRFDVTASTRMMMAFTEDNGRALKAATDREPLGGDLYLAHFLGAGRAEDSKEEGDQRKGAIGILTTASNVRLQDLPWMRSTINANPSIRNFTVGQLRAWAAAKFDGRVDEVRDYDAAVAARGNRPMTEEELEAERREREQRRNSMRIFGRSEEEIDAMDQRGDLMGPAFLTVLGGIIAALFGMAQGDVEQTYDVPVSIVPAGYDPEVAATTPDAGLAAAAAAVPVPASLRGQTGVPANQTTPTTQLAQLARPAAPAVRQPIPA